MQLPPLKLPSEIRAEKLTEAHELIWFGDKVYPVRSIYTSGSGDSPPGFYAYAGDTLYVRDIFGSEKYWDLAVSHSETGDESFYVLLSEIMFHEPSVAYRLYYRDTEVNIR